MSARSFRSAQGPRLRDRPPLPGARRLTSAVMAGTLAVTLLAGSESAFAAPVRPNPHAEAPKPGAPVHDLASARLAAKLWGRRVEVLGARTTTSTTWANPDGTLTTETAAGPIRFRRGADWVDVNVAFAPRPDGTIASQAHPRGLSLSGAKGTAAPSFTAASQAPAQELLSLSAGAKSMSLQWKGGLPAPTVDGARATYRNVLPSADLVVDATRTGYEQSLVLRKRPAGTAAFTLPIKAPGVAARQQRDGSVLFTEKATGRKLSTMPAPVMWDAAVDGRSLEHTHKAPVGLKVVQLGDDIELRLTPNAGFLADPATKYPVTVDPSDGVLSDVFDTFVQQGDTADQSNTTDLKIGWPGDYADPGPNTKPRVARSFITWDMAPIKDALVSKATLSLFNYHSWDCTRPTSWEVWDTGTANTGTVWTAQPTWYQRYGTSTETKGQNCSNGGYVNADVTTLLQYWAGQTTVARQGLGIRATDEANTLAWKRFYSGNAAATQIPKLSVTYNYRPKTGTDLQAGPPFFANGSGYVVNTLTPNLRDTFSDTDNDQINGTFQIFDGAMDTQIGNLLVSPYAPSGQPVSVTVPAGLLQNGRTYRFRTNPYDGTHYNVDWSAWRTFTVDTTAPSAPASVASTDYPSSGWVKGVGQTGAFTVTPPSADHEWIEWTLDGTTWTKVATNGATTPVTLQVTPDKGGTNTLQVRSVDKADNKSEPVPYVFHVGAGGITSVVEGQRTPARLPLAAEADASKYDKVTFAWRRSDADPWAPIPPGHVTRAGQPLSTWPVALTDGTSPQLVWNATSTADPDGAVQIKADFTGPGGNGSADALRVVVDRTADGAASTGVGPGTVNLLTGSYNLGGNDASAFDMTVTRSANSRTPDAGARQDGQAPIFGKEWVSGVQAAKTNPDHTAVRQTSDTSLDLVKNDGTTIGFTANTAGTGWVPEPGAEHLTLTGSFTGVFTLTDNAGSVTTFAKASPAATVWTVTTSLSNGLTNSTTEVISETVTTSDNKTLARPKRIITASSAVTLAACEANQAARGCRILEFVYADTTTATASTLGDHTGQVRTIRLWATAPGAAASTATEVSRYAYDSAGRLREVWDPRISPALKTAYAYDAAGRVTQLTPAGQLPWTFAYGQAGGSATAGDGMLLSVARPTLAAGSTDQTDGTATTTLVYGVPVTGASAPQNLGAAAAAGWGQTDLATDATAVFPADQIPASSNGPQLAAGSYGRATTTYLDASGRPVNTVRPGGGITTTEYDRTGHLVRELTAGNRELALGSAPGAAATLNALGISGLSTAERALQLSTQRRYSPQGTRELEVRGPLHTITLAGDLVDGSTTVAAAGTAIAARTRTVNEFDTGRPTDGTAVSRDEITKTSVGAQPRVNTALLADTRVTATGYDWTKGLATSVTQDPGGLNLTKTTSYDAQGRVTRTTLPASNGTDAGATVTTYYSGDGTGPCGGRPEWADLVCTVGPAANVTGGGANPTQLATKTNEYGLLGQVTKVTEVANGVTRTTTTGHDAAARPTTVTVTGGLGTTTPATTTGYDPATGLPTTSGSPTAGTITKAYDRLGRLTSYTDADGGVTTTQYDALNRPTKVTDTAPSTTTYTYDTAIDPRGLLTSTDDSAAGVLTARYDADGAPVSGGLPGGYTMRQTKDTAGNLTARTYTRDTDNVTVMNDSVAVTTHGGWAAHTGTPGQASNQAYTYDAIGRLTQVADSANGVCTTRTYTFDKNTNRTAQGTTKAAPGAPCTTSGATTATHTYDSGDRLTDTGYTYDALGRTTAQPGATTAYYTNDLAQQQTAGNNRQTWTLDAALRFRGWTTETNTAGTWSPTASKLNHYGADGDNPRWIVENTTTGGTSRQVTAPTGSLAAVTTDTGAVALELTGLHNDINITLPLNSSQAPQVLDYDEYGNPKSGGTDRYGWLGGHQRSSETPTRSILMGVRVYNPATGRFQSTDPVRYGSANAYDYADQNPVTNQDLTGLWRVRLCCGNWYSVGIRWDRDFTFSIMLSTLSTYWIRFLIPPPWGWLVAGAVYAGAWNARQAISKRKCAYSRVYLSGYVSWGNTPCF
ncbi:DNRLRE domain-containing protein [Streptomyces sp. 2RAF24]|uniref:DNRLRE domain-containing protein n=1 Tax=Streptomyces sp. 2RAF24 TaxID=3232997 RepID=UPI003F9CBA27